MTTNPTFSNFDDDDVSDNELLAAFADENIIANKTDPIVPTGNTKKKDS